VSSIRIKLGKEEAEKLLNSLPGGSDLYEWLAEEFLRLYEQTPLRP
jgi:hypothetical protein